MSLQPMTNFDEKGLKSRNDSASHLKNKRIQVNVVAYLHGSHIGSRLTV